MSRRVVATDFGGPEVLSVVEYDPPAPGPGEVQIAVRAAGINPIDHKRYSGAFGTNPDELPMSLGFEVAGVVVATGEDASGPRGPITVGDAVIGYRVSGGYADEITVAASNVVPKPGALSWEQAAGLMLAGVTAVHALHAAGAAPGDTLLMHGGSGAVGVAALQRAVANGVTVIATASVQHHDLLRELGANPITYGPELVDRVRELAPSGVDASVDFVGTDEAIDSSLELTASPDRIITIAAFERASTEGFRAIGGGAGADPGTEIRSAARLELIDLAEAGEHRVFIGQTFPLTGAAAAHQLSIAGHPGGKLVLVP